MGVLLLPKLIERFPQFVQQPRGNEWFQFAHACVYIRMQVVYVQRRVPIAGRDHGAQCVVIANVSMPEAYQRKGDFNRLIAYIQSQTRLPIVLENVLNDEWAVHLLSSRSSRPWRDLSPEGDGLLSLILRDYSGA